MGEETLSKREIRGMGKIRRALVEWEKVIRAFYGETFLVERLMFFFVYSTPSVLYYEWFYLKI